MGIKGYLQVFPGVFFNQFKAFVIVGSESLSLSSFFLNLGLPVLIVGAYGRVLGEVGATNPDAVPPVVMLFLAHFFVLCIGVFLGSIMLAKLSPRYGVESSLTSMAKISIASYIPICIAFFVSGFGVGGYYLVLAGLVATLYLFGKGLRVVLDFPPNRVLGFVFIAFLIFVGVMYFFLFLVRVFFSLHFK